MALRKKAEKTSDDIRDMLGPLEMLVMISVQRIGDEAYGMAVFEFLHDHLRHKRISFGSIYTALERLLHKGYLESRLGEPEPARGGRARKYYRVSALGEQVMQSTKAAYATAETAIYGEAATAH